MKTTRIILVSLLGGTMLLSSCGFGPTGKGKRNSRNSNPAGAGAENGTAAQTTPTGTNAPATDDDGKPVRLADIPVAVGIRNFSEINETYGALTGISPSNTVVATSYTELSSQLPLTNDIRAFVASHQVAATKLAVEYCDQMFEDVNIRAQAIPGFNFGAAPSAAFTPATKALVADSLINKFWGKDLTTRPTNDVTKPDLIKLIDDILQGKTLSNVNLTRNTVKGVCTAVLSSAPVLFY